MKHAVFGKTLLILAAAVTMLSGCTSKEGEPVKGQSSDPRADNYVGVAQEAELVPEFSKLTVTYDGKDVTADTDTEALGKYLYSKYSSEHFREWVLDTELANICEEDEVPAGSLVISAQFGDTVIERGASAFNVLKVLPAKNGGYRMQTYDESYRHETECVISLTDEDISRIKGFCGAE